MTAAALHMMDSAHGGHGPSPSSSTSPAPPWLLADDDSTRCSRDHHQFLIRDDLAPSSAAPFPAHATALPNHHRPTIPGLTARKRVSKRRRPRPSRKLPTTYIAADPGSFRRMVHHVTGADNLLPVPPPPPVCLPAPSRAAAGSAAGFGPGALPTLDTSALFLSPGFAAAPALEQHEEEAGGGVVGVGRRPCDYGSSNSGGSSSCGGFPTLDSFLQG